MHPVTRAALWTHLAKICIKKHIGILMNEDATLHKPVKHKICLCTELSATLEAPSQLQDCRANKETMQSVLQLHQIGSLHHRRHSKERLPFVGISVGACIALLVSAAWPPIATMSLCPEARTGTARHSDSIFFRESRQSCCANFFLALSLQ